MFTLERFDSFKVGFSASVKKQVKISCEDWFRIVSERSVAKKDDFRLHRGKDPGYF